MQKLLVNWITDTRPGRVVATLTKAAATGWLVAHLLTLPVLGLTQVLPWTAWFLLMAVWSVALDGYFAYRRRAVIREIAQYRQMLEAATHPAWRHYSSKE